LVQDSFASAILERSLKAYRSLGGFALPIVQDPRDLDTPAGRVILVNTATKVILPMDRSGQDDISRFVHLNERELELVRNLRLVKRRYSEFFVSVEGVHSAKGLVIPDPLRYAISTTDPVDEAELERLFQETGDMLKTVQRFAHDMPYGVRANDRSMQGSKGFARRALLFTLLFATLGIILISVWVQTNPDPRAKRRPAISEARIADRQNAAEQAARLLQTTRESPNSDAPLLSTLLGNSAEPHSTTSPERSGLPTATMTELRELARSLSAESKSQNESPGSAAAPRRLTRAFSRASPSNTASSRARIPDQIEEAAAAQGADPLQQMSLQGDLITLSPGHFPGLLLETRVDQTPPQARLSSGDGTNPSDENSAWFSSGDSPAPGWTLVHIQSDGATVMSSLGGLVRLSIATSSTKNTEQDRSYP
jgi:hypothetical protein